MIARHQDNNAEEFPLVDEQGNITGSATRGECHNGSMLLHPVVHLHVTNNEGSIYLQKRPAWKDIQPNKWDTAVGGHVELGENVEMALRREAEEELGIIGFEPQPLTPYVFQSKRERELVYPFRCLWTQPIRPSAETDGGRWWTLTELRESMGKDILTPNLEQELKRLNLI